jgi:hypothetical protein
LLTHRGLPLAVQFVGEVLEGAYKPIGGDDEAVFHVDDGQKDYEETIRIARLLEHARRLPEPRET